MDEGRPLSRGDTDERLERLRAELKRRSVDGFIIPRTDEYQGEYVPASAQRLAWLTGFTGSAGLAIVLPGAAAVFVDGRYTLQAEAEVDGRLFQCCHVTETPPASWIAETLKPGESLGYDPRLLTLGEVDRYRVAAEKAGGRLIALDGNPVDAVWSDRPAPPLAPVVPHELRFAGESAEAKRGRIAAALAAIKADAAVLTAPDSIAWLLNIRGGDVPHTPLPLSFAVLHADASVDFFIDREKLSPGLEAHLGPAVRVAPPSSFGAALEQLAAAGKRVAVDPASATAWVFDRLRRGCTAGDRSVPTAQSLQERGRAARRARSASPRWRGADAVPGLACAQRRVGQFARD